MNLHQAIHHHLNAAMQWRKYMNESRKGSRKYAEYLEGIRRQHKMIAIRKRIEANKVNQSKVQSS